MNPFSLLTPYRLRIVLRMAFPLLAIATVGLAVSVLQQEKQLSYQAYENSFYKTREQIAATLRHPTGQLALLNPAAGQGPGLHPVLLPYAALDFDDQAKVQQAISMAGCAAQYGDKGTLCVGIGNNPWAGGFVYVAGTFHSPPLAAHPLREESIDQSHRVDVKVSLRGQEYHWIAPFEQTGDPASGGIRGRLTGYTAADAGQPHARPVKDFRGWIWQSPVCAPDAAPDCTHSTFFSVRLPVGVLQDALFAKTKPTWPPEDLANINVSVAVLPPRGGPALLDTTRDQATPLFSLRDLESLLLPGETLRIRTGQGKEVLSLSAASSNSDQSWHALLTLVRHLPVDTTVKALLTRTSVPTPLGNFEIELSGDARSVSDTLSVVATRVSWFVGAILGALLVAWLVVEAGIIRPISILTRRADKVARSVKTAGALDEFDLSDLRGRDELGVLANCLHDLLRRVREDVEKEAIRAEQERDMWHAVGHEIMSPLQSLMALHGGEHDPSGRYIHRMQQAVRVLYGQASPSEAFQSTTLQLETLDLDAFLRDVAANAHCVGIDDVSYGGGTPAMVRADPYSLEDVVTHILNNANRHRTPGTPIIMTLSTDERTASLAIHNQGEAIEPGLIDKVFEYGVSGQEEGANRGQGLFVVKTYMAKMGGTVAVRNVDGGVEFTLTLHAGA
ncbi:MULTISPECIES: HAMP domain-containing sensor histidine kinase [unclassified Duganella]|uniref:sensor histidine kinase n=1 Tax=unclassified Duganella TaxID=2636909 RepID=UPI0006FBC0D0|nr:MULTISPECIES: HAMP domain-containing sensor histidine kinase [unclassified Duganella]KQV52438.1 histidine kinase [Duganella sp. Root336D2]KRB89998.1 histidine kinase [Duganella sp. Root198D2]